MEREQLLLKYRYFAFGEYINSLQDLNVDEQIHFTDVMIQLCRLYYFSEPDTNETDELIEREILIKYRSKMKYFALNEVWECLNYEGNSYTKFLAKLQSPPETEALNVEEHTEHILNLTYAFHQLKLKLYVADPNGNGLAKKDNSASPFAETPTLTKKFKSYTTRAQQVLLLHFLSMALEIKVRGVIPVTNLAKFYNGLFGWEYDDINNSTLYKHFKKDPLNRHNKKELYEQLHWVKDQFLLVGLADIVAIIDKEIKKLEMEIF